MYFSVVVLWLMIIAVNAECVLEVKLTFLVKAIASLQGMYVFK